MARIIKKLELEEDKKIPKLYFIIFILLLLLLLIGVGFYIYAGINYNKAANSKVKIEQNIDTNENNIVNTRIIRISSILNNQYIGKKNHVGYIYSSNGFTKDELDNDYIIYTGVVYTLAHSDVEKIDGEQFNIRIKKDVVDNAIQMIFGDIDYNYTFFYYDKASLFIKYDYETEYYYVNNKNETTEEFVDLYYIKTVEIPQVIELYEATGFVDEKGTTFFDFDRTSESDEFLTIMNYQKFKKYKLVFEKGSDNLYHFDRIEMLEN